MFWSEYSSKAVAQIQARGMAIDMELWNLVQEHKHAIITALLKRFDPSHNSTCPIFDQDGGFEYSRFENWLVGIGVKYWPRTETGKDRRGCIRVDGAYPRYGGDQRTQGQPACDLVGEATNRARWA
jgi:hypothetical protein